MSDFQSRIDDSFGGIPWPPRAASPARSAVDHTGPREGRWDVASSVGSYIDDRFPAVAGYGRSHNPSGHVNALGCDLARQLTKATLEERAAVANAAALDLAAKTESTLPRKAKGTIKLPEQENPTFAVPWLPSGRKRELAGSRPDVECTDRQNRSAGIAAEAALFALAVPVSSKKSPPKQTQTEAQPVSRGLRKFCIVSKTGEAAFMEIPAQHAIQSKSKPRPTSSKEIGKAITPPNELHASRSVITALGNKKENKKGKKAKSQDAPNEAPAEAADAVRVREARDSHKTDKPAASTNGSVAADVTIEAPKAVLVSDGEASKANSGAGSARSRQILKIAQRIASLPPTSMSRSGSRPPTVPYKAPSVQTINSPEIVHNFGSGVSGFEPVVEPASKTRGAEDRLKDKRDTAVDFVPCVLERPASQHQSHTSNQLLARAVSRPSNVVRDAVSRNASRSQGSQGRRSASHWVQSNLNLQIQESADRFVTPAGSRTWCAEAMPKSGVKGSTTLDQAPRKFAPPTPSSQRFCATDGDLDVFASQSLHNQADRRESDNKWENQSFRPQRNDGAAGIHSRTKFAGTGWISPHPLSVIPAAISSSPQRAVRLPGENFGDPGRTLTFEEWKAQRDELATVIASSSYGQCVVPSLAGSKIISPPVLAPAVMTYGGSYNPPSTVQKRPLVQTHDLARGTPYRAQNKQAQHQDWSSARRSTSQHSNSQPGYQRSNVHPPGSGWNMPPQVDGSGIKNYSIGLTPGQLQDHQQRVESTMSHYTKQIPILREELSQPQPEFGAWNRHSSRSPNSASHGRSTSITHPHGQVRLAMPWDVPHGAAPNQQASGQQHAKMATRSQGSYGSSGRQNLEHASKCWGGLQDDGIW